VPLIKLAYYGCFRFIDQHFLKFFGPVGLSLAISAVARQLSLKQTGFIPHYAFFMGYMLLLFLFVIWLQELF
jgi:hypothetical protein